MKRLASLALALLLGACTTPSALEEAETAFEAKQYAAAAEHFTAALEEAEPAARPRIHARLGNCLKLAGELKAARTHLEAAIATGDPATVALAQRYLGRLLADQRDLKGARAAYDAAHRLLEANGPKADLLKLQIHRGGLAWYDQDFDAAWSAYADAYHRASTKPEDPARQADGLDGMAMLLTYAGEEAAAMDLYQQSITFNEPLGRTTAIANARAGQATIHLNARRFDEAETHADQALDHARTNGVAMLMDQARLIHAGVALGRQQWAKALAEVDALLAQPTFSPHLAEDAHVIAARALAGAGRWADLDARLADFTPQRHETRSVLATLRARQAHAQGDHRARRAHLEAAIKSFEALRARMGVAQLGSVFTQDRLEAYEALLGILVDAGDAAAALRLVGQVKARSFAEALRDDDYESVPLGLPDARTIQRARLRFKLAKVPPITAPARVQAALPPDVAAVEYYALPDRLLIFWIDRERVQVRVVPQTRTAVVDASTDLLDGIRDGGVGYEPAAARLGEWLLDPIAAQLNEGGALKALVVVPHGALHTVPFEALPWAGGLLVDRFAVISAANLTAVDAALRAPPRPRKSVLAVGDADANLPGARREVQEVADLLGGAALIGSSAQESAVRAAMRDKDLLHFAVHGIQPGERTHAYLALAADSASDGKLHADELASESLTAALVVLSVCDSARGTPNAGDEIVGVIDRAFLRAGARSVLASRWPVHDAASVLFMRHFYADLRAGRPLIEAFHGAQLALRRKQAKPSQLGPLLASLDGGRVRGFKLARPAAPPKDFAHPYFWAAFSLRGALR